MRFSQGDIAALRPEDRAEYLIWENLFDSPGFKLLTDLLEGQKEGVVANLMNAGNWDNYNYNRGARDAFDLVLNLEAAIEYKVQERLEALLEPEDKQEDFL